jgi:hypothetical protein
VIDWFNVFSNALWILGLALLLTTFSLAHWLATDRQEKSLRQSLSAPPCRLTIAAGLTLVALGLMLTMESWWYKIGWVVICVFSIREGVISWQEWFDKTEQS